MRNQIIVVILFFICNPIFSQGGKDTLVVGYTSAPPFIIDEGENLEGISVWLWSQCAKELEIEYQLVALPFGAMLDSLESGGIDLSINPLTITSQRMRKKDFTLPFYTSHSVVARGKQTAFQRFKNFIGSLLSFNFLSGFLVLFILTLVFALLIWNFEKKENQQDFRPGWKGAWDGLWWSVVTMTTVGYGDKTPKTRGGKIVALVWMFSGLLFISGLTASVASSLTVDRLTINSENFNKFKNREIGTIEHSSSEDFLRDYFFRNINVYNSVPEGLDDVLNGKIEAFVYDEPIVRYQMANDKKYSKLDILSSKLRYELYAFGLPKKNKELKEIISQKIIEIVERDDWQRILGEYRLGEELD